MLFIGTVLFYGLPEDQQSARYAVSISRAMSTKRASTLRRHHCVCGTWKLLTNVLSAAVGCHI